MQTPTTLKKHVLHFTFAILFGLCFYSVSGATQPPLPDNAQTTIAPQQQQQTKTVVYYFHGNMRCTTCKKIEAYTKEAIQSQFADALKDGHLELKVVNVEDSGNYHYVEDFRLYTRSVVVEKRSGNKQLSWKNLDKVWGLVRDKSAFLDYIQREINDMMEGA